MRTTDRGFNELYYLSDFSKSQINRSLKSLMSKGLIRKGKRLNGYTIENRTVAIIQQITEILNASKKLEYMVEKGV